MSALEVLVGETDDGLVLMELEFADGQLFQMIVPNTDDEMCSMWAGDDADDDGADGFIPIGTPLYDALIHLRHIYQSDAGQDALRQATDAAVGIFGATIEACELPTAH